MSKSHGKQFMENVAALCKRRGFVFQASEIYGGFNGFWDYGPLGIQLKNNIRNDWWRHMVECTPMGPGGEPVQIVGLDSAIVQNPKVWVASGHVAGFNDPMVDCRACKARFRADQIGEYDCPKKPSKRPGEHDLCDLTEPRSFNLMFETYVGAIRDEEAKAFLRPETAQGIFLNFKNIVDTMRVKVPFGIAQVGKAFRNEVTPRNFIFRSREFEQMEMEWFCHPDEALMWYEYWKEQRMEWWKGLGIREDHLRFRDHGEDELAHYSRACVDVEYLYPFTAPDFGELEGIAHRGCFDLSQHQEHSGQKLEYFDAEKNERFVPNVIEPASGLTRAVLVVLCEAYAEEWVPTDESKGAPRDAEPGQPVPEGYEVRTVLRLLPKLAPVKAAVFPLLKNKPELVGKAQEIYRELRGYWPTFYDQTGAIGRRYRRQDEIGTPFGITVDFQTLEDQTVTVRHRDSMKQERLPVAELASTLSAWMR
ncbi:MAG TPA: glycine--tRNA ligase [Kiritimatiellia bacterium]|nr:glycine--tRNA ligase [Kiritimatiellia bacterium]